MGQLTTTSQFLSTVSKQVKIKEVTEEVFSQQIKLTMAQVIPYLNLKKQIEDWNIKDVERMLKVRYKHLGFEEIVRAFENERYGVYSDKIEHYQEFNADYVSQVLNRYEKWKRQNRVVKNTSTELSEQEKKKITNRAIEIQHALCKAGKRVPDHRLWIYDEFWKSGLITQNEKEIAWRQSKERTQVPIERERITKTSLIKLVFSRFATHETLLKQLNQ